jgi:hypothetical protein
LLEAKQKEKESPHTEIERDESERVREEPDESSDRNVKAKGKGKASDDSTTEGDEIEETAEAAVSNEASVGEEHVSNRPKTPPKEPPAALSNRGSNGRRSKKQK